MGLTRLQIFNDGVESEMVCALLRGYGIKCASVPANVPGTSIGALIGGAIGRVSGDQFARHDVLVNEEDLERAREILAAPIDEESAEPGT
jgi:Putative prokaryotic signal transducing protein